MLHLVFSYIYSVLLDAKVIAIEKYEMSYLVILHESGNEQQSEAVCTI